MSTAAYPTGGVATGAIDPEDSVAVTLVVISELERASLELVVIVKVEVRTPGAAGGQ